MQRYCNAILRVGMLRLLVSETLIRKSELKSFAKKDIFPNWALETLPSLMSCDYRMHLISYGTLEEGLSGLENQSIDVLAYPIPLYPHIVRRNLIYALPQHKSLMTVLLGPQAFRNRNINIWLLFEPLKFKIWIVTGLTVVVLLLLRGIFGKRLRVDLSFLYFISVIYSSNLKSILSSTNVKEAPSINTISGFVKALEDGTIRYLSPFEHIRDDSSFLELFGEGEALKRTLDILSTTNKHYFLNVSGLRQNDVIARHCRVLLDNEGLFLIGFQDVAVSYMRAACPEGFAKLEMLTFERANQPITLLFAKTSKGKYFAELASQVSPTIREMMLKLNERLLQERMMKKKELSSTPSMLGLRHLIPAFVMVAIAEAFIVLYQIVESIRYRNRASFQIS